MKKTNILLSKSKIKQNSACKLMLWNELNIPSEKVWEKSALQTFEQGRLVEAIARAKFKDGVLQDKINNLEKAEYTKELLKSNNVIFEAAFIAKNTIIQFDILSKREDGSFDAIEIKSSSSFKSDYELDVIVQYWIATLAGIKLNSFQLWHVNKNSTSSLSEDYFTKVDVLDLAKSNEQRFNDELTSAQATALLKAKPDVKVSAKCNQEECPFRNSSSCPMKKTKDSVFALPKFPNMWDANNQGIVSVLDEKFDKTYKYSELNPHIIKAIRENRLVLDQENINKDLSTWKLPFNFFDFETLMGVIPTLEGQCPFEQVVFQFSNHVWDGKSNTLGHDMFIHDSSKNPTEAVILAILSVLEKNNGSIVSYNKTFEMTRIKELANKMPQYKERLLAINERFVDLMDIVKDHVYHPNFMGSYSLKVVSPSLLGEFGSYSDSLIKSGSEIAKYYTEMVTSSDSVRKEEIKAALFKYCFYDTLNLFLLLKFLMNQSEDLKSLVEANVK